MKALDKIVVDKYPPRDKDTLWNDVSQDEVGILKKFVNGKWQPLLGGGSTSGRDAAVTSAIPTTSADLRQLRDEGKLVPGLWYRITNYVCDTILQHAPEDTMYGSGLLSDQKLFDILIQAISSNRLGEDAYADHHLFGMLEDYHLINPGNPMVLDNDENTQSDPFADRDLSKWKLKYSLDADRPYAPSNVYSLSYVAMLEEGNVLIWLFEEDSEWYIVGTDDGDLALVDLGYPVGSSVYFAESDDFLVVFDDNIFDNPNAYVIGVGGWEDHLVLNLGIEEINHTLSKVDFGGVVLYMTDENGNEANYDFVNIYNTVQKVDSPESKLYTFGNVLGSSLYVCKEGSKYYRNCKSIMNWDSMYEFQNLDYGYENMINVICLHGLDIICSYNVVIRGNGNLIMDSEYSMYVRNGLVIGNCNRIDHPMKDFLIIGDHNSFAILNSDDYGILCVGSSHNMRNIAESGFIALGKGDAATSADHGATYASSINSLY